MRCTKRICMVTVLLIVGGAFWAMSDDVIRSNDLEITTSILTNAIGPNLPVIVVFKVKNLSREPVQINHPSIGSMDVVADANASVICNVLDPSGTATRIRYGKPFIGPLKEIETVSVFPAMLKPDETITARLIIGGNWEHPRQGRVVFTQYGQYSISLDYYPFTCVDTKEAAQIDMTRFIKVPPIVISVIAQHANDAEAWGKIQKLKHWWIMYDPEMRNAEYLSPAEQEDLANELKMIAREYPKSSYSRYLDYAEVALQIVRKRGQEPIALEAIQKLDALASDQGFAYSLFARDLSENARH